MISIIPTAPAAAPRFPAPKFTLTSLLAILFMVTLREKLDADTGGDKADAAYTCGL